ncbi:hypothetical protein [Hoyosella subflava]|uniref:Uncharacterized protein n=1 Tax=Hoyosella subflava (strain DSM 45089 / JCM 17490 / NBRC 109087 / DQS3-9A1) TaxID=443218 RepID=F6ERA0_HOYSD|nr:hypothetical protein [Hoyosella subflava]AEF41978.1 hypothetical protein AS9A_3540 [Hoyosella subflava DQS3-9A1]
MVPDRVDLSDVSILLALLADQFDVAPATVRNLTLNPSGSPAAAVESTLIRDAPWLQPVRSLHATRQRGVTALKASAVALASLAASFSALARRR